MNDKIFKKLDSIYGQVTKMEILFEDLQQIAQTVDSSFQPLNLTEYIPIHQKSLVDRIHIIDCRIYEIENAMRELVTFLQKRLEDDFKDYD